MRIYYFASTYWDREWYLPFQGFRVKLLQVAEQIIKNLEEVPGYHRFTFDGQTVVLDDINEIRPDLSQHLKQLVSDEKLNVGPWYTMPDELLVSGESLIRNLLVGRAVSCEYGHEPWPVGYVCDVFGHIAQMSQIFAGFGIKTAVASRGIDANLPMILTWIAPDGTSCKLLKQGFGGYGNFYPFSSVHWTKKAFVAKIREFLKPQIEFSKDAVFLFDGYDHEFPSPQTPELRQWLNVAFPDAEVIDSDFTDIKELPKAAVSGELTAVYSSSGTGNLKLVQNSISSRYDIKYNNDKSQSYLEQLLEPLLAYHLLQGNEDLSDRNLLRYAWKNLLKNQAHDCICGCSIDQTHRDMAVRYREVQEITDAIVQKTFEKNRRKACADSNEYTIEIFNPLPYTRNDMLKLKVTLPVAFPAKFTEPRAPEGFNSFRLFDEQNNAVPFTILSVKKNKLPCPSYLLGDQYYLAVEMELKPYGWTPLTLKASEDPVRSYGTLRVGKLTAENKMMVLKIHNNGTFSVLDKRNKICRDGFNSFLLDSDCGDGWYYVSPVKNGTLVNGPLNATVKVVAESEFFVKFEIVQYYQFAAALDFKATVNAQYSRIEPSEKEDILPVKTTVVMRRDSAVLDVTTVVENNLRDYRLRLSVPTQDTGNWFASQAFTMLERIPGRALKNQTFKQLEAEVEEQNFSGIAGKSSPHSSMAFLSAAGLHEVSCPMADPECLYVTMLRAVQRTVGQEGEPDGEQLKKLKYHYGYAFFDAPANYAALFRLQQSLQVPSVFCLNPGMDPVMKKVKDFPQIKGNIVVSCIKPSMDGKNIILRIFNPSKNSESVTFSRAVFLCEMNETGKQSLPLSDFEVLPHKIITVKVGIK